MMTKANGTDPLHETAAKGVEAIHQIVHQRDQLLKDSDRMATDLMLMRERAEQLEGRLNQMTAERDHYMRFSTELVSQLNTVRMVIDDAQRTAKQVAFKPPLVPTPKSEVVIDTKGLEGLLSRLPANGGEKVDVVPRQ